MYQARCYGLKEVKGWIQGHTAELNLEAEAELKSGSDPKSRAVPLGYQPRITFLVTKLQGFSSLSFLI